MQKCVQLFLAAVLTAHGLYHRYFTTPEDWLDYIYRVFSSPTRISLVFHEYLASLHFFV